MGKFLLALGCLAAFLVIAVAAVSFFLGSIVKAGVNRFGPGFTKTRVELADAQISLFTGSGTISGLLIGNPPGWQSDKAIYLGRAHVAMQPRSLFRDHIIIDEILIDRPEFVYESRLLNSNLNDLLKNLESQDGEAKAREPADSAKPRSGKPMKLEVRRFCLQNGTVTIGVGEKAVIVPLPKVELVDLGTKEGGIPADQLAGAVMKQVLRQVLAAVVDAGKEAGASGVVKKAGDAIKKLFGGK
jgi:hypothetical protein